LLSLVKPAHELTESFERLRDAAIASGDAAWGSNEGTRIALTDAREYVDRVNDWAEGENLPQSWVPCSTFWIVDDGEVVGELSVRHHLQAWLREIGGHIGYITHPQHRRRGIATFALREGLTFLRRKDTAAALVTCGESNVASIRVIENCGGVRVRDAHVTGLERRRRYVFPLDGSFGEFEDLR